MTSQYTELIIGPPGTGKTTKLLSIVEELLERGYSSKEIGFFAFTRKAATEAVTRAIQKFGGSPRDFPYFRTIHSLCFQQLGLTRQQVLNRDHYRELGDHLGIEIRGSMNMDGTFEGVSAGDKMVFLENVSRNRVQPLRDEWERADNLGIEWGEIERYSRALQRFKENRFLIDYTDMLHMFIQQRPTPRLKAVIVDEAQDLSELQWRVIDAITEVRAAGPAKGHVEARAHPARVYWAGDDDQAIYLWAGAEVSRFLQLGGVHTTLVRSYRVPETIQSLSLDIAKRIIHRRQKVYTPVSSAGRVDYISSPEEIDLERHESLERGLGGVRARDEESWLFLGRNRFVLQKFRTYCDQVGLPYETDKGTASFRRNTIRAIYAWTRFSRDQEITEEDEKLITSLQSRGCPKDWIWHRALDRIPPREREHLIAALRAGESIREPRAKISTIHGAKGGEADNVVIALDMARSTYEEYLRDPDSEHRVWYVAVTRAKKRLYIVQPDSRYYYDL